MRIRTIKPEMFRSSTVTSWPVDVRWTFAGLFCYCDDEGRGRDDSFLIKADIWPRDRRVTEAKINDWLALIAATAGDDGTSPLCRYEVEGVHYLHLTKPGHQKINRPSKSKIPQCPLHEPDKLF